MTKRELLSELKTALTRLVSILELDPKCRWTTGFKSFRRRAAILQENGFSDEELAELSASIMHVYGGMGSFNDYAPDIYNAQTGRAVPIPGTEDFGKVSNQVYDLAQKLRLVEPA